MPSIAEIEVKVLATIALGASLRITLTQLEVRGLCRLTPRQAAHALLALRDRGLIRLDPSTRGWVPTEEGERQA